MWSQQAREELAQNEFTETKDIWGIADLHSHDF